MNTVLLYASYTDQMSYYDDWLDAFCGHKDFQTTLLNTFDDKSFRQSCELIENAELVVLHHSMTSDTLAYLKPYLTSLKSRKGILFAFVGNEVNLPILGLADKINLLKSIAPDFIGTQLLLEAGQWLYAECKTAQIISIPHALNPDVFFPTQGFSQRKIDIATRSARYGVYLGDNERNEILHYVHEHASQYGFNVDLGLSPNDHKRFTRPEWAIFLNKSKATLSTETGTFYLEKDDVLVQKIQAYLSSRSSKFVLPKESVSRKLYRNLMPSFIRKFIRTRFEDRFVEPENLDEGVDFQEVYEKFFRDHQKCPVYSKAISSRHFDAIGTKTLHIMYPGRYNDILKPGEHYFELRRDHKNMDELKALLSDQEACARITNNTYEYVRSAHTHAHRLDKLVSVVGGQKNVPSVTAHRG